MQYVIARKNVFLNEINTIHTLIHLFWCHTTLTGDRLNTRDCKNSFAFLYAWRIFIFKCHVYIFCHSLAWLPRTCNTSHIKRFTAISTYPAIYPSICYIIYVQFRSETANLHNIFVLAKQSRNYFQKKTRSPRKTTIIYHDASTPISVSVFQQKINPPTPVSRPYPICNTYYPHTYHTFFIEILRLILTCHHICPPSHLTPKTYPMQTIDLPLTYPWRSPTPELTHLFDSPVTTFTSHTANMSRP